MIMTTKKYVMGVFSLKLGEEKQSPPVYYVPEGS